MKGISRNAHIIEFPQIVGTRGDLSFIESDRHIPFDIARVYYLYNVPSNSERGAHAHRKLQQVIIALSGSFRVAIDNGYEKAEFWLDDPAVGLFVGPLSWRLLDSFSQGAVAVVLASLPYDADDYIRDYSEFISAAVGSD